MLKRVFCLLLVSWSMMSFSFQTNETVPKHSQSALSMFLGLIFVLVVIYLLVWISKKIGIKNFSNSALKVTHTLALTSKEKLVVVEFEGKKILLGVAPGCVNCINIEEVSNQNIEQEKSDFSSKLMKVLNLKSNQAG